MDATELLKRVCAYADKQVEDKTNRTREVDFKTNLQLKFYSGAGWRLGVFDNCTGDMKLLMSSVSGNPIDLGDVFIWQCRSEDNDSILEASIGDDSIDLPVLGREGFYLSDAALKIVLNCIAKQGAVVRFDTLLQHDIRAKHSIEKKALIDAIFAASKQFGKASHQVVSARANAWKAMLSMEKELDDARLEVKLVPRAMSCVEELEIAFDLQDC